MEDKTGRKIFKGDILKISTPFIFRGSVEFRNGKWLLWRNRNNNLELFEQRERVVLIGNRWDNPKSLEDK